MKRTFKKGKLVLIFLIITLILTLSHVVHHYEILSREYSTKWGQPIKIEYIDQNDMLYLSEHENNLEYIKLKPSGEIISKRILPSGIIENKSEKNTNIHGFDETIFKYNIQYENNTLFYIKNKNFYRVKINYELNKVIPEILAENRISKINIFNGDQLYSGYLSGNTITILDENKNIILKTEIENSIVNFDFVVRKDQIEIYTIENKDYKMDEIKAYSFIKREKYQTKVIQNIDINSGFKVYRIKADVLNDTTYLSYAQLQNDRNSNVGDIFIKKINSKNFNYNDLSFINDNNEFVDNINKEYVLDISDSGLNLIVAGENLKNEISDFSDIINIDISNNFKIQNYDFPSTTYGYSRIEASKWINDSRYVLTKDVETGGYSVFINSNSPEYIAHKKIPKEDMKSAIMQGILSPFYSIMHLFINTISIIVYILVPIVILGSIFFMKRIENNILKFTSMYTCFVLIYIYNFKETYISMDVLKYAPEYLTSKLAIFLVPVCILLLSLVLINYYFKKINEEADYTELLILGILATIYISTLMYAPYNYVRIILMNG